MQGERKIFISRGNQIGPWSDWLPGWWDNVNSAARVGMAEFEGDFTLWENDPEGNPVSIDIDVDDDGKFFEI